MALNFVVIQDLTFTETSLGNLPKISYTNGGIAGSEVVTVSGNTLITVQISSGVSTATQIKAAVDANFIAHRLATVTISGTGSNVQNTVNGLSLAGGTAVATATLTVGGTLLLTAVTTGTAGNNVRFKFTGGATAGSEVVTVSTNDITCQIADGVSTFAQIKTAYDLVSAATALATTSSAGLALSGTPSVSTNYGIVPIVASQAEGVAYVAMLPSFTSLAGGVAATAASITFQGLTIPFGSTGLTGNSYTVTFTAGATAGAEVVSLVGTALSVQIKNGTSTVTQIRTAINSAAPSGFGTVTGTASTTPLTVNQASMSGGSGASSRQYYQDQSTVVLTTSYQQANFPDQAQTLILNNDETSGTKNIIYSFDNFNTAGKVLPTEKLTLDDLNGIGGISLKEENGAPAYRLEVIGK